MESRYGNIEIEDGGRCHSKRRLIIDVIELKSSGIELDPISVLILVLSNVYLRAGVTSPTSVCIISATP